MNFIIQGLSLWSYPSSIFLVVNLLQLSNGLHASWYEGGTEV